MMHVSGGEGQREREMMLVSGGEGQRERERENLHGTQSHNPGIRT